MRLNKDFEGRVELGDMLLEVYEHTQIPNFSMPSLLALLEEVTERAEEIYSEETE